MVIYFILNIDRTLFYNQFLVVIFTYDGLYKQFIQQLIIFDSFAFTIGH